MGEAKATTTKGSLALGEATSILCETSAMIEGSQD